MKYKINWMKYNIIEWNVTLLNIAFTYVIIGRKINVLINGTLQAAAEYVAGRAERAFGKGSPSSCAEVARADGSSARKSK